jgi:hypothetical protein
MVAPRRYCGSAGRGDSLRIGVLDENTGLPVIVAPDLESLSGRGLLMVAWLVTTPGAQRTATGKVVWAELESGGAATSSPWANGRSRWRVSVGPAMIEATGRDNGRRPPLVER